MNTGFVEEWLSHYRGVMEPAGLVQNLSEARELIADVRERDGRLLFAGNGASATISSHYALDFTKQGGVRSLAFNDAALLTAYGNDYGYERWVSEAIRHHGRSGDVAVLISTSGGSPNIVNGARTCLELGIEVIAMSGFSEDNPLNQLGRVRFWVQSRSYNVVESVHGMWLGVLCDMLIGAREYGVGG